jgi:hypothetical protein
MLKILLSLTLVLFINLCLAQSNTWVKLPIPDVGVRYEGSLVYVPDSNRFLLTMGNFWQHDSNSYTEMMFNYSSGKWINFLPNDSLYGKWADSAGYARGLGLANFRNFGNYFIFKKISGYLRPNLYQIDYPNAYYQSAYDPDDKKIYYYINNWTFCYNTQTRQWDTLSPVPHPAGYYTSGYQFGTSSLMWSALCYDPVNQEILLFGGGGVDAENGNVGTWTYKPATNTWTRRNSGTQPPPRCNSPMVYDPMTQKIILFGGDHFDQLFSDTWVYDCATRTWSLKTPALCPAPRAGHALLYLPKSRKVVLIGGYHYT